MGAPTTAERAVQDIVGRLVAAWNVHDARAFAAPFAADADFTNVFGMRAKGREAIEQFHAPVFSTMFRQSRLAAADTRVRLLRPDVAAVDISWTMTGARDPQGTEWPERKGLMNLVITREANEWSIAVMHNMDLPGEELAKAQEKLQHAEESQVTSGS